MATVSSQVYKKFIAASAEKIKVIPVAVGISSVDPDDAADGEAGEGGWRRGRRVP